MVSKVNGVIKIKCSTNKVLSMSSFQYTAQFAMYFIKNLLVEILKIAETYYTLPERPRSNCYHHLSSTFHSSVPRFSRCYDSFCFIWYKGINRSTRTINDTLVFLKIHEAEFLATLFLPSKNTLFINKEKKNTTVIFGLSEIELLNAGKIMVET